MAYPHLVVTHQLQVKRRTGKVRRPETDVLPLCHATNQSSSKTSQLYNDSSQSLEKWNHSSGILIYRKSLGFHFRLYFTGMKWDSKLVCEIHFRIHTICLHPHILLFYNLGYGTSRMIERSRPIIATTDTYKNIRPDKSTLKSSQQMRYQSM